MFKRFLLLIALVSLMESCTSDLSSGLNAADPSTRLGYADKLFKDKKYSEALELYSILHYEYSGKEEEKSIEFNNAYCNYYTKDYVNSAAEFATLYRKNPKDERAEEAYRFHIKSLLDDAPRYNRDQKTSKEVLSSIAIYQLKFPNSTYTKYFNSETKGIYEKLERKDYEIAYSYFRTAKYKATIVALRNFLEDYPESKRTVETKKTIVEAKSLLAINSVLKKKQQRILDATAAISEFKSNNTDLHTEFMDDMKSRLDFAEESRIIDQKREDKRNNDHH